MRPNDKDTVSQHGGQWFASLQIGQVSDNITCLGAGSTSLENKKKRKTYAFRRQFNEKPSIILGCPGLPAYTCDDVVTLA